MKIRHGFVSNSSSSSFVVALPKKPKTEKELQEMLFGDSFESINDFSLEKISKQVFLDICNAKKPSKKAIKELFAQRYHIFPNSSTSWYYNHSKYCGSNSSKFNKIVDLFVEQEAILKEHYATLRDFDDKHIKRVEYASLGLKYSPEKIKKYDNYVNQLSVLHETKEYKDFRSNAWVKINKISEKIHTAQLSLADDDVNAFMNDCKDKYVFIASYSDNDGDFFSTLEHENIFSRVTHIVINQH